MSDKWVYRLSDWRECDGCGRSERLDKSVQEFKGEDGKIRTKISGTWIPMAHKDFKHTAKCVLEAPVASKK